MTTKYKDTGINHFEDDNKLTALFSSLHCNGNMWQMGDRREEGRGVVEKSVKRQYSFSARTAKKKALQVQIVLTRSLYLLCEFDLFANYTFLDKLPIAQFGRGALLARRLIYHSTAHTSYLSFFLHRQNFWRIKFTPKNAQITTNYTVNCQFYA